MALGREYSYQDITLRALSQNLTGAQGISYKSSQASTNVYGLGKEPRTYSRGKREYEAELTVTGSQLNQLISSRGAGRSKSLLDIRPFDVVVTYTDSAGSIWTDVLRDCRFTEVEKSLSLDDDFMEVTLPLAVGRIDYNTVL